MTTRSLAAAAATEIYSGEPLQEALHDLVDAAILISHEISSASPLVRTDVFRLSDGKLVAITSRASKLGGPYSIEELRITASASASSNLTKRLKTVSSINLPKRR